MADSISTKNPATQTATVAKTNTTAVKPKLKERLLTDIKSTRAERQKEQTSLGVNLGESFIYGSLMYFRKYFIELTNLENLIKDEKIPLNQAEIQFYKLEASFSALLGDICGGVAKESELKAKIATFTAVAGVISGISLGLGAVVAGGVVAAGAVTGTGVTFGAAMGGGTAGTAMTGALVAGGLSEVVTTLSPEQASMSEAILLAFQGDPSKLDTALLELSKQQAVGAVGSLAFVKLLPVFQHIIPVWLKSLPATVSSKLLPLAPVIAEVLTSSLVASGSYSLLHSKEVIMTVFDESLTLEQKTEKVGEQGRSLLMAMLVAGLVGAGTGGLKSIKFNINPAATNGTIKDPSQLGSIKMLVKELFKNVDQNEQKNKGATQAINAIRDEIKEGAVNTTTLGKALDELNNLQNKSPELVSNIGKLDSLIGLNTATPADIIKMIREQLNKLLAFVKRRTPAPTAKPTPVLPQATTTPTLKEVSPSAITTAKPVLPQATTTPTLVTPSNAPKPITGENNIVPFKAPAQLKAQMEQITNQAKELETKIQEITNQIKQLKTQTQKSTNPEEKLALKEQVSQLEVKKSELSKQYFAVMDKIASLQNPDMKDDLHPLEVKPIEGVVASFGAGGSNLSPKQEARQLKRLLGILQIHPDLVVESSKDLAEKLTKEINNAIDDVESGKRETKDVFPLILSAFKALHPDRTDLLQKADDIQGLLNIEKQAISVGQADQLMQSLISNLQTANKLQAEIEEAYLKTYDQYKKDIAKGERISLRTCLYNDGIKNNLYEKKTDLKNAYSQLSKDAGNIANQYKDNKLLADLWEAREKMFSALANKYSDRLELDHNSENLSRAIESINKAVSLDPSNPQILAEKLFLNAYDAYTKLGGDKVNPPINEALGTLAKLKSFIPEELSPLVVNIETIAQKVLNATDNKMDIMYGELIPAIRKLQHNLKANISSVDENTGQLIDFNSPSSQVHRYFQTAFQSFEGLLKPAGYVPEYYLKNSISSLNSIINLISDPALKEKLIQLKAEIQPLLDDFYHINLKDDFHQSKLREIQTKFSDLTPEIELYIGSKTPSTSTKPIQEVQAEQLQAQRSQIKNELDNISNIIDTISTKKTDSKANYQRILQSLETIKTLLESRTGLSIQSSEYIFVTSRIQMMKYLLGISSSYTSSPHTRSYKNEPPYPQAIFEYPKYQLNYHKISYTSVGQRKQFITNWIQPSLEETLRALPANSKFRKQIEQLEKEANKYLKIDESKLSESQAYQAFEDFYEAFKKVQTKFVLSNPLWLDKTEASQALLGDLPTTTKDMPETPTPWWNRKLW